MICCRGCLMQAEVSGMGGSWMAESNGTLVMEASLGRRTAFEMAPE